MNDSDEYFDDSFVLEEADIASIQATEERFVTSLSQAHCAHSLPSPPPPSPTPHKRLKTSHGWVNTVASAGTSRAPPQAQGMGSMDQNPEVRVGPDGSYIISTQSGARNKVVGDGSSGIEAELVAVRAQLVEMSAANAAIQQSLREAQEARLTKAGEVSILRQTIDRTKKEYAEAVAMAKADMIAHEKVKTDLQTKLKEETERMTTRLAFKQHEIETSTRKPTWGSARSRRVAKDFLLSNSANAETPTRVSVNRVPRQTIPNSSCPGYADSNREDDGPFSSPTRGRKVARHHEKMKQPQFKGFHNAFVYSEPVGIHSPTNREDTGGEHGLEHFSEVTISHDAHDVEMQDLRNDKSKGGELNGYLEVDRWQESNADQVTRDGGERLEDVDEKEGQQPSTDSSDRVEKEDMVPEEDVDCSEELRRLVFTHIAPQNNALTIHVIISTILPPDTVLKEKQAYTAACQVILEICGVRQGHTQYIEDPEWEADVVDKIANAFVTIGGILGRAGCLESLVALLDLLMLLILYIPAFSSSFLSPVPLEADGPSQLLSVLCDIILHHIVPPKPGDAQVKHNDKDEDTRRTLAMVAVQLMESLCWTVKDGLVEQLGLILRRPQVFDTLLDPAQPPDVIACALQLLILLATHKNMFRSLLAFPEPGEVEAARVSFLKQDPLRIPLVEKLCYFLVKSEVEDSHRIQRLVIALIHLLSDCHIDARMILFDSLSLAPSLVICITTLSRILWEDELAIMESPELARRTVGLLYSSVLLLHHLVSVVGLSPVLGRKLVEAARLPGAFNGVTHMFIVTFGRLSWADGPDWLDGGCREMCEAIAELALEIIETVVAGPECDSLWAVWHQEVADDEEDET